MTPPPGRSSTQDDGGTLSVSGPVEIGSVLNRLHNLELLAHMQSGNRSSTRVEAPNNTAYVERTSNKGGGVIIEEKENLQDLGMMLAKIQVIKSDFDVVAQVMLIHSLLLQSDLILMFQEATRQHRSNPKIA